MKKKSVLVLGIIATLIIWGLAIFYALYSYIEQMGENRTLYIVSGCLVAYGALILSLTILSYKGKRWAAIVMCIVGAPMYFLPSIAGIIALRRKKEKPVSAEAGTIGSDSGVVTTDTSAEEKKHSSAQLVVSILVAVVYAAMLIIGIMFGIIGLRFSDRWEDIMRAISFVALALVPTILVYFAAVSERMPFALRIIFAIAGTLVPIVLGVVFNSTGYFGLVDLKDAGIFWTFGISSAPFIGSVGFVVLSFLPIFMENSKKKLLRTLGAIADHPVGRLFSVLVAVLLAVPLGMAIMVVIVGLFIIFMLNVIWKYGFGQSNSIIPQEQAKGKEVYTIFVNGYERQLVHIGFSELIDDEHKRHEVYQDDIGNYWISDDGGQSFYPHPSPDYIVRN